MVQSKTHKHLLLRGLYYCSLLYILISGRVLVSTRGITAAAFYYYFLDWLPWLARYVALSALL